MKRQPTSKEGRLGEVAKQRYPSRKNVGAKYLTDSLNRLIIPPNTTPTSAATTSSATIMMVTAIGSRFVVLTQTAEKFVGNMKKQIISSSIPRTEG